MSYKAIAKDPSNYEEREIEKKRKAKITTKKRAEKKNTQKTNLMKTQK